MSVSEDEAALREMQGPALLAHINALYTRLKAAEQAQGVLKNLLREVVEASDAFDRVAHLSVREDQPGLEATIATYKAAIEKARGPALRADEVLQAQPKRSPCCNCAIRCGRCGNELREEKVT